MLCDYQITYIQPNGDKNNKVIPAINAEEAVYIFNFNHPVCTALRVDNCGERQCIH